MIVYRKIKKQSIISSVFLIITLLMGLCLSVNAQENIKVYNRNKEITLFHGLFLHNEKNFIHIDDLSQLDLNVTEEENIYTITSNDAFGMERKLVINLKKDSFVTVTPDNITLVKPTYEPPSTSPPGTYLKPDGSIIIIPPEDIPTIDLLSAEEVTVEEITCSVSFYSRKTETIGTPPMPIYSIINNNNTETDKIIKVNEDYYISSQFIGDKLSHGYSEENGRIDFYIANSDSVLTDTYLVKRTNDKHDINVYTAYKTGEGDSIADFEILSSITCTVPENEKKVNCFIETPAEKIDDANIYFIVDFGERYFLTYDAFDFSAVGRIEVYGEPKDITFTAVVNLPETAECDVPFTVLVPYGKITYSNQGIVKSGENFGTVEITGLPKSTSYETYIKFDYNKYKNIFKRIYFYNTVSGDFSEAFTPEYSNEVACTVSLPDDFMAEGDVEVKLKLSNYRPPNSLTILTPFTYWDYTETIILNKENPSKKVYLYNQISSCMLTYSLSSDVDNLHKSGYLQTDGKVKSNFASTKEIKEDLSVDIQLLKNKTITVNVYRPISLSTETDIFAFVKLYNESTVLNADRIMDFTESPLIPSGKSSSSFEFIIAEDKAYNLNIADIAGDDRLFNYCWYVENTASGAQSDKKRSITFSNTNTINLYLLECNNISGVVTSEKNDLNFTVTASCKLPTDEFMYFKSTTTDGKFSLKLPQNTFSSYTLSVQTSLGKNSYYISDGISTNAEEDATNLYYEHRKDKNIIFEYIVQNPTSPVELSFDESKNKLNYKNVSDYLVEADIFIAYYDSHGRLISIKILKNKSLQSGKNYSSYINSSYHKTYNVKIFAWKKDELVPLANMYNEENT